jgi:hypothetical protein
MSSPPSWSVSCAASRGSSKSASIEHVFDPLDSEGASLTGAPSVHDWFDPAWLDQAPELPDADQSPVSQCVPWGWLALELDQGCADPAGLSDAELIDAVIGFDHVASWASARQTRLLAEFARRRPGDHPLAARCDTPSRASEFAPDEIGLALRLSRTTATGRLVMSQTLVADLPGTLAAWQAGAIDTLKARAITEASYLLPREQRGALKARILPRAETQTIAQLRAVLTRAVLAIDLHGAQDRHKRRRQDRRVVVSPDEEGMATLWALLSALDATAAYQRLCELARSLGAEGTWRRLLTDPVSGTLLDYGRTTYTPPAGLADFVRARDLHCRFPICGQRAATADLDHTVPYPDGKTSEHNLHASCRHHHRLKTHTTGWGINQYPDGRITWTTPTGHTHTSHPHDYQPDPHPPPGDESPPF